MTEQFDLNKALADQKAQAARFMSDLAEIGDSDRVGMWHTPPGMELMVWFRCGVRYGDGSLPPAVARLYHKHRAMGAMDAPADMRPPIGFESDGKLGVYIWYDPHVWNNIQNAKAALTRRRPSTAERLQNSLGPGIELTVSKGYERTKRGNR